jgi:hypothetical protein
MISGVGSMKHRYRITTYPHLAVVACELNKSLLEVIAIENSLRCVSTFKRYSQ